MEVMPLWSVLDIRYTFPSESTAPFFLHTTVVAGEPVEVQLRVKTEVETELVRDTIDGFAVRTFMHDRS